MKIAVFSSWHPVVSRDNAKLAKDLGAYLSEKGVTVVTGGCSGIPALVVEAAKASDGKTIGYFPHKNQEDYLDRQHEKNTHPLGYYDTVHFVSGFTARSLKMVKDVDAAIVLNGRIGTLSEFGIAVEEGLRLAVIEGTGGIADQLLSITAVAGKEFPNDEVVFVSDYKRAVDALLA